ncbi:hypothetical protein H6G80_24905 [Nostoc sp. FACHB-87]|uniref:hypothetical protein n=1 Tax=Nostocaceae TaxID=1162 RepID=UPI001684EEDC|nr:MULTISPECIES: hypothetical protein [Nostocaceae]MBD2457303.1 hypothetical protein [Nostoc sp. FACHB-87]MBD2478372.1 hypothetical protein [Anabaena sp. FACHB-83]
MSYRKFSEQEAWIINLINSALPADIRIDLSPEQIDKLKGGILQHLIQTQGQISDSDVQVMAKVIFENQPLCNICNNEGYLTRSLYVQIFPERTHQIPLEALYVACDCSIDEEDY